MVSKSTLIYGTPSRVGSTDSFLETGHVLALVSDLLLPGFHPGSVFGMNVALFDDFVHHNCPLLHQRVAAERQVPNSPAAAFPIHIRPLHNYFADARPRGLEREVSCLANVDDLLAFGQRRLRVWQGIWIFGVVPERFVKRIKKYEPLVSGHAEYASLLVDPGVGDEFPVIGRRVEEFDELSFGRLDA